VCRPGGRPRSSQHVAACMMQRGRLACGPACLGCGREPWRTDQTRSDTAEPQAHLAELRVGRASAGSSSGGYRPTCGALRSRALGLARPGGRWRPRPRACGRQHACACCCSSVHGGACAPTTATPVLRAAERLAKDRVMGAEQTTICQPRRTVTMQCAGRKQHASALAQNPSLRLCASGPCTPRGRAGLAAAPVDPVSQYVQQGPTGQQMHRLLIARPVRRRVRRVSRSRRNGMRWAATSCARCSRLSASRCGRALPR